MLRIRFSKGILTACLSPVLFAMVVRTGLAESASPVPRSVPGQLAARPEPSQVHEATEGLPLVIADSSLLSVVPEGTEVAKGQVIAELEQPVSAESLRQLSLAAARAKADWENAIHTLRIRELEWSRAIRAAELKLKLLHLDQKHYLAVESVNTRESLEQAKDFAQQRFEQAQIQAQWSQELADQGYLTRELLERDRAAALQAKADLNLAKDRIRSFEDLTHRLRQIELGRKLRSTETDLRHRKQSASETLERLRAEVSDTERRYRAQKTELDALQPMASPSVFRAPRDGVVMYADSWTPHGTTGATAAGSVSQGTAEVRPSIAEVESENMASLEEAEQKVDLARLESEAYLQGTYPQARSALLGEISIRRENLKRAEQRLKWSERVIKKGYITKTALQEDRLSVAEQREKLKRAERRLKSLEQYVFKRRLAELTAELTDAEQEMEQRRTEGALRLAQARCELEIAKLSSDSHSLVNPAGPAELAEAPVEKGTLSAARTPPDWPPLLVVGKTETSKARPDEEPAAKRSSSRLDGRLRVPVDALVRHGEESFCFVRTTEGIRKQKVVPGKSDANVIEVKTGVEKGDLVVANPRKVMGDAVYGQ